MPTMRTRTKLLLTVAILAALAAGIAAVVHSAFTSTARNEGSFFQSGFISLTDNDSERVLFDARGLVGGAAVPKRCLKVVYGATNDLRSTVRLYGTTTGTLAPHLRLKVTRGTFTGDVPPGNGCAGFKPNAADTGHGPGVLFDDTLSAFPHAWADGIVDPDAEWQDTESAVYQLEPSLAETDLAQGKSSTQSFVFEARTA